MQNDKLSMNIKSIQKNIISGSIVDISNKEQLNEQSVRPDSKSRQKVRNSSPKRRKRKRQKPVSCLIHRFIKSDFFFKYDKIKSKFLNCFNIKELIILMDVNSTFYVNIIQLECFKKYIKLRQEFILKENIYQKIIISNNEEKINYTLKNKKSLKNNNSPENKIKKQNNKNENSNILNNNIKISQSRVYHEKFNSKGITNPVKLGLNNVLTIYPTLAGEKEKNEKEEEEIKNNNYNKLLDELNNKNNDKISSIKEEKKNLFPPLDYKKLEINTLLKNNADKIKKLTKKYNLSQLETKIIFNGIIENLIFMNDLNDGNDLHPIVIQNLKASNGFNYYVESLLNIDFDEIVKIHFDNVLLNNIHVMKTLSFIFHKYSNCLKILILSNNQIDDKCSKLLFPSLQGNKVLNLLDLSNNCISNEGMLFSELFFIDNRSMSTVVFDNNILGPIGIFSLCSFLRKNQKININLLDLGYNGITKEGINHLVNYIKNNKNKINKLYLGGNYLCDDGIEILSKIFKRINIIKEPEPEPKIINNTSSNKENNKKINLNNKTINSDNNTNTNNNNINNNININNKQNLYYEGNNKISFLDLQNNNLTKKSSNYISTIIMSNNPEITELILSNNNLGNEGIIKIISSIKINNKLLSLDISETKIDEKTIKYISETLDQEYVLEKILLSKNNLKKSCIYIKNLLTKKTNVKYLKLSSCKIEDNFNLIFQGLTQNKMLYILDLSNNNLSLKQELFEDISNTLKINNTLIKLKLNETNIDDIAIDYISKGLEENKGLRKLYLKKNYLTKKSINMLKKAIDKNNNCILTKIDLKGNDELNNKLIQEIEKVLLNKKESSSEYNSEFDVSFLDYNKKYDDN